MLELVDQLDEHLSNATTPDENMVLQNLPYDLLLNIASRLELSDVHALHLTCKSLYHFSTSRPVYRKLAADLLRRCRALPLKGFQRITDLSTPQLMRSVNKATRYEAAWRRRGPRPIELQSYIGINSRSNYMDLAKGVQPDGVRSGGWYKVVSAPPGEDVDWLSPITSSYTLCATKSGKVVCWDVQRDACLAEWNPCERWELWKCRVEFEEKTVFFTMAKALVRTDDDSRVMEFVLMKLKFYDSPSGESTGAPPNFSHVATFRTAGVVMNVFLLDPTARLLSAFVWVATTNTIGLYALPDWDKPEYVFIDTGIECVTSSNWSCILFERNIVIHCEESDCAYQYFYPLRLLQNFSKQLKSKLDVPMISYVVSPAKTLRKRFVFPPRSDLSLPPSLTQDGLDIQQPAVDSDVLSYVMNGMTHLPLPTSVIAQLTVLPPQTDPPPNPNPFPFPPWCPDSAHFVRQWWPSLPGVPRVSCTVVLLAAHDQETHRTRFILAQHYFKVPLDREGWMDGVNGIQELRHKLVGRSHRRREEGYEMTTTARSGSRSGSISSGSERGRNEDEDGAGLVNGSISKANGAHTDAVANADEDGESLMHLWYVSTPFEVVCVMDGAEEDDIDEGALTERPRPLVAVDFGHAVWIEFMDNEDDEMRPRADSEAKWLRFVTFPPFGEDGIQGEGSGGQREGEGEGETWTRTGGQVRTLEIPPDLDLDLVETINIDQSQGAVILSVRDGKIFILCYE